jgi:hypothetical protein
MHTSRYQFRQVKFSETTVSQDCDFTLRQNSCQFLDSNELQLFNAFLYIFYFNLDLDASLLDAFNRVSNYRLIQVYQPEMLIDFKHI